MLRAACSLVQQKAKRNKPIADSETLTVGDVGMADVRFFTLLMVFVPGSTTVIETTQIYNCKEELHQVESEYAVANPDCDQYWVAEENSIATFLKFTPECHSPCHELFAGRILLTDCINVTLAVICSRDYLTEHRVHFYGERTLRSLSNPVKRLHTGVLLVVLLLIIVSVCCIAVRELWKKCTRVQNNQ